MAFKFFRVILRPYFSNFYMSIKEYLPFYKRNLQIGIPVLLSQLGQMLVQQADNIMLGHVGTNELAAASFAGSVFMNGLIFGMGFTFGLTPLVGKAFGENNKANAAKLFQNSMIANFFMGFILTVIMFGVSFLMDNMGQPHKVVEMAMPYYYIQVFSMIPFLMFFTFKQFAEGIGNTKAAMFVTLSSNVINIIFNYLFIFGKFGFPEYGVVGAAYATFIARTISPILFLLIFIKRQKFKQYFTYFKISNFNRPYFFRLIKIGIPVGFQMIIEMFAFSIGSIMMGWFGTVPIAAHQIALGLSSLTFMLASGIAQGTTIRVSHQLGAHNYSDMRKAVFASVHLILLFMSFTATMFLLFRTQLAQIYSVDNQVIDLAAKLLIVASVFQIFDGMQIVTLASLRGIADVKRPLLYAIISFSVIGLPVGYLCAFILNLGPQGIWYGFLAALGFASVLFYTRFNKLSLKLLQ